MFKRFLLNASKYEKLSHIVSCNTLTAIMEKDNNHNMVLDIVSNLIIELATGIDRSNCTAFTEHYDIIKELCQKVITEYEKEFETITASAGDEETAYIGLCNAIDMKTLNWGRVVALASYAAYIAKRFYGKGSIDAVSKVSALVTAGLLSKHSEWIESQNCYSNVQASNHMLGKITMVFKCVWCAIVVLSIKKMMLNIIE